MSDRYQTQRKRTLIYIVKQGIRRLHNIKKIVKRFPLIGRYLRAIRRTGRYRWIPKSISIFNLLELYSQNKSGLTFVQIGANTGDDQFHRLRTRFKWNGIMVEPQREVYQLLCEKNAQLSNIVFENVAISDSNGVKNLYKPAFSTDQWATSLASFDPAVIEKHISNGWIEKQAKKTGIRLPERTEDFFVTEEVACLTLECFFSLHSISSLDLMIMDTEGHDFEIIKQLDFKRLSPNVLIFEHKHLTAKTYRQCLRLLRKNGYRVFQEGPDTLAVKSSVYLQIVQS